MKPLTESYLHALAQRFHDIALAELEKAETAGQVHEATMHAHERLMELEQKAFAKYRVRVACKAGCGTCCHLGKIDARAYEVFALADWIRRHFSAEEIAGLISRARARAAETQPLTLDEQFARIIPCPLLRAGSCSAHPARPDICRIVHSTSFPVCERVFAAGGDPDVPMKNNPESKLILTVASEGTAFAFHTRGFDKRIYDLSAALHEALTDPAAETRWLNGEQAFSTAAFAKQEQV